MADAHPAPAAENGERPRNYPFTKTEAAALLALATLGMRERDAAQRMSVDSAAAGSAIKMLQRLTP